MNRCSRVVTTLSSCAVLLAVSPVASADPWADRVVRYVPGEGVSPGFDEPGAALGEPTRVTAPDSPFGGAVTPFQSPFGAGELVTVGAGGSLTLAFDEPVTDDPRNPFGIDLLVFGNAFLFLDAFPDGVATGGVFAEGGEISLSADGRRWVAVPGVDADGRFPTLGYLDLTSNFPPARGAVPSDFTRPVNPRLDVTGLGIAGLTAGYDRSGGGAGIDIGAVGLSEVRFIRIEVGAGAASTPEIDAVADVSPIPIADWNDDGRRDVFDLIAYADAARLDAPGADLNGDGGVDVFDFLLFLEAFADPARDGGSPR